MADISSIKLPDNSTYGLKDAPARESIITILSAISEFAPVEEISQSAYDALPDTKNSDDTIRFVPDGEVDQLSYDNLTNKPQINGITISGSQTGEDLGLMDDVGYTFASNCFDLPNGERLYIDASAPTGSIPMGAFWIGGDV